MPAPILDCHLQMPQNLFVEKSNKAVEKPRGVESEVQTVAVQSGERNSTGIKRQNYSEEELESAPMRTRCSV